MLGGKVARALVVHGASAEAWAKKYNIHRSESPCPDCGNPLIPSIPFALGGLRGLKSECGSCGGGPCPYVVVHLDGTLRSVMEE